MPERRELYRSPNGDAWFLGREPTNANAFIIHQPNAPSGGKLSHIELGQFLRKGEGPEQQALLRLIGTLVEVPPYADERSRLGDDIGFNLPADVLNRIDVWAGEHDVTTREEAIHALLEIGSNTSHGAAASLRTRAATLAGDQLDRMADGAANNEEREDRKSRLMDGPSAFRNARRDRPEEN